MVGATVIIVLVGLFLYGRPPTCHGWSTYAVFSVRRTDPFGVWNTLQLTVYAMILGVVLGIDFLGDAAFRPTRSLGVAWVFLWIFRGTPVTRPAGVLGACFPTIYQNVRLGVPFGAVVLPPQPAGLSRVPFFSR